MRRLLKASTAIATIVSLVMPTLCAPAIAAPYPTQSLAEPAITAAGGGASYGATFAPSRISGTGSSAHAGSAALANKVALLKTKVKYVFVIFQENRSFDHYFGSYPGANGLYATFPGADAKDVFAQPATALPSWNSQIRNVDGSYAAIHPFLIPRSIVSQSGAKVQLYPEDLLSVDHSHGGYINDIHADIATRSVTLNDGYALDQQGLHFAGDGSDTSTVIAANNLAPTANPTLQQRQKAEVVMGHIDCDTIPFLWDYADRFTLFDNFHQTNFGPSTPNAIAMIAAQVGDTQWVKHGANGTDTITGAGSANTAPALPLSVPNETDTPPFAGGRFDDAAVKPPYGPDDTTGGGGSTIGTPIPSQVTLTFASLPLSFMGNEIKTIIQADQHPAGDLADVQQDIAAIAAKNPHVNWGWYQQGFGPEPFDGETIHEAAGSGIFNAVPHASYIVHHNGPQYFGYLGDNTVEQGYMHGLAQFYTDVAASKLPASGGVFYVRGGYYNNDGLKPVDPNPNVQNTFMGNDDHGSYSDSQLSEAMVADTVNAIASSPYWKESAIIITYDESDGFYDHQPERVRTYGPDGLPETGGPRIPAIVISPYAATHAVSHVYSEHSSVIKFINTLFSLTPLASLPDEAEARAAGAANPAFNKPVDGVLGKGAAQTDLGPADGLETMGDLTEAFDNDRLNGTKPLLPARYAMIDKAAIKTLPHYNGAGCNALKIVPTDYARQAAGAIRPGSEAYPAPRDFNPRPTTSPGAPFYNTSANTAAGSETGTGGPWGN